jgi:hypothetical protein
MQGADAATIGSSPPEKRAGAPNEEVFAKLSKTELVFISFVQT